MRISKSRNREGHEKHCVCRDVKTSRPSRRLQIAKLEAKRWRTTTKVDRLSHYSYRPDILLYCSIALSLALHKPYGSFYCLIFLLSPIKSWFVAMLYIYYPVYRLEGDFSNKNTIVCFLFHADLQPALTKIASRRLHTTRAHSNTAIALGTQTTTITLFSHPSSDW